MKNIYYLTITTLFLIKCAFSRTSDSTFICNSNQFWDGFQCINCLQGCSCGTTKIQDTCDGCITGYQVYNPKNITFPAGQTVCLNCAPECGTKCCFNTQSQVQVCQNCPTSYYLNNDWFCSQCLDPNCQTCNNNGVCTACLQGYFLNQIGICQPCTGSNCLTCGSSGSCTTCQNGFYPDSTTGSCLPCTSYGSLSQNCASCSTSNPAKCSNCLPFYYADGQGRCRQVAFCDNIQPVGEVCLSCADGYYQDTNGKCKACPQFGVARCSSATTIIQCTNDKSLTYDKSQCVYKISHCTAYQNTGLCKTCDSAFSFNSKGTCIQTCQLAIPNCQTCVNGSDTVAVTCSQCSPGYFIGPAGTSCVSCSDFNHGGMQGCQTCVGTPFSCSVCLPGYFLDTGNICKGCTPDLKGTGCQTCQSATVCQTCLTNTFGTGGACNLCDISCGQCTDLGYMNCKTSCSSNLYYLDNTTNCRKCNYNMPGCYQCSGKSTCTQCYSSYYLSTDPTLQGTQNQCQLFQGCKVKNQGTSCQLCSAGYKMTYQGCKLCLTIDCTKGCTDNPTVVVIKHAKLLIYQILISMFIFFLV
ncbi:hypothetical protein ABPG74_002810 [Tetrahymena malaccensis]